MRRITLSRLSQSAERLLAGCFLTVPFLLLTSVPLSPAPPAANQTGSKGLSAPILTQLTTQFNADLQSERSDPGSRGNYAEPVALSARETNGSVYNGYLRVYLVEPVSRYADSYGVPFDFGLLDFAYNQSISLGYTDTIRQTVIWNSGSFGVLQQDNIMVLAAVFNGEGHTAYSSPGPPPSYPFTAHWVDAAASAASGQTGVDTASGSFTHNAFIEWAASSG